ncbi:MAG TPA: hypothetical protein VLT36_08910 [Candidatus Dormibacteraeota bacterium]|nr:hypothetical protein [Candidatus Dormibacteraeota bacterium]
MYETLNDIQGSVLSFVLVLDLVLVLILNRIELRIIHGNKAENYR